MSAITPVTLKQILQIAQVDEATFAQTNSTSWFATSTFAFTPKKITSKILIQANLSIHLQDGGGNPIRPSGLFKIARTVPSAVDVISGTIKCYVSGADNNVQFGTPFNLSVIDTPATISPITYTLHIKSDATYCTFVVVNTTLPTCSLIFTEYDVT